jgi:hypothetical protein
MFLESSDTVAAFGRYAATGKATGVRVDPPSSATARLSGTSIS